MTIEEAIKRYADNAEYERTHGNLQGCLEFKRLEKWLEELKQLREQEPCEDAISRQAVIEYIKASDAELGHSSEKEIVVEDIKCIATVKFSKEEAKWLKELRAYRKIYHKEHVDDCLRAESEG